MTDRVQRDEILTLGETLLPSRLVLTFHGIGAPRRAVGDDEQPYWITERHFATIVAAARGDPRIEFTFDDGNCSDFHIAYPVLQEAGLSATFFVLAGRLDREGSLGRAQVRALALSGMRIGSHGFDHVDWRGSDAIGRRREISEARRLIAAAAEVPVQLASAPFGGHDATVREAVRLEGFRALHTSDPGRAGRGAWLVRRNTVTTAFAPERDLPRLLSPMARMRSGAATVIRGE